MKKKQKPLSFSLCEENIAYVAAQHGIKHRNKSHWMDDLLTHLRTKSETNIVPVEKPKAPVKRFVPPTVIEVWGYMIERGCKPDTQCTEAHKFCDHFESNGWKVGGKTKMVNWKASVRNWLKNNSGKQVKGSKTSGNLSACEDFING